MNTATQTTEELVNQVYKYGSLRKSRLTPCRAGSTRRLGVIFGWFSEAVQKHPVIVSKYLGSVVPYSDNFFAAFNAAVEIDPQTGNATINPH